MYTHTHTHLLSALLLATRRHIDSVQETRIRSICAPILMPHTHTYTCMYVDNYDDKCITNPRLLREDDVYICTLRTSSVMRSPARTTRRSSGSSRVLHIPADTYTYTYTYSRQTCHIYLQYQTQKSAMRTHTHTHTRKRRNTRRSEWRRNRLLMCTHTHTRARVCMTFHRKEKTSSTDKSNERKMPPSLCVRAHVSPVSNFNDFVHKLFTARVRQVVLRLPVRFRRLEHG